MKFTLSAAAVAMVSGLATSTAGAAVLFSDTTDRRVNDTNVQVLTFVPFGSIYANVAYSGTLYFRWTITNANTNSGDPNSWLGLHLWNNTTEGILVGKSAGGFTGYSAYANGGAYTAPSGGSPVTSFDLNTANPDAGKTYQSVRSTDVTTFVMRVDFNANARDLVTIYLNPDLTTNEASQSASRVTTRYYNAAFNGVWLREGGPTGTGLNFSNISIGETQGDVGFTVPAPGAAALLGMAGLIGTRRRR